MPHDGVAVLKHHAVYPHVHTKAPGIKSCFTAYCIIKPLLPRHVIGLCKSMHPWECVSDSQAIKKLQMLSQYCTYTCLHLMTTVMQRHSSGYVLIHCIATAVRKTYTEPVCMWLYVSIQLHS